MSDSDNDVPDLVDLPINPTALPSPDPSLSAQNPPVPDPVPPQPYDFDNKPVEVWDTYSVRPTPCPQPPSPVKFVFSRHWLSHEERGLGYPPCSIGMKVQMGTVRFEIELPKTFKHACSIDPETYRNFWRALRACAPFEWLSSQQKDVIRGTLAAARFFCDNTVSTRRHWPPFRQFLLNISQLAGEHGVPGEDLFRSLATWAGLHFPEALNTVQWELDNN